MDKVARIGFGEGSQGYASDSEALIEAAPSAQDEITYLTGVNANGSLSTDSFWGSWSMTAFKYGTPTAGTGATITYAFDATSSFTQTEKNTFRDGFAIWAAVANLTFTEAPTAGAANVLLLRGNDGSAWQDGPTSNGSGSTLGVYTGQAQISIDTSVYGFDLSGSLTLAGGYGMSTVIHEIGHLIGLGHGGGYNGSADPATEQYSPYDMQLWTLMSYISWTDTDAKYWDDYTGGARDTNWGTISENGRTSAVTSPQSVMTLDIEAAQRLYGAPTSSPLSGGNVFGFNTNIIGPLNRFFDFASNTKPVLTLFSTGTNNVLDLSGFASGSTVNLAPGSFSSAAGLVNNIVIHDRTRIETAIGGAGADTMDGDATDNALYGGDGADVLRGNGGADRLFGGAGADAISGGAGADAIYGGADNDTIYGLGGGDVIYAESGDDFILGGSLAGQGATIDGGDGNDRLWGGAGVDYMAGGRGDDVLVGLGGADSIYGGDGADYVVAGTATGLLPGATGALISGDAGADWLYGGALRDVIYGGADNDVIVGLGGADWLFGNDGDDYLVAGDPGAGAVATMDGGAGADMLWGSVGDDVIYGGDDGDLLVGGANGAFVDFLFGGAGNDTLYGGAGSDVLEGGAGDDFFWTDDFGTSFMDYIGLGGGSGVDTVADFTALGASRDILVVAAASGVTSFAQLSGWMSQAGVYAVVQVGQDAVYLYNVSVQDLTANNFIFV